MKGPRAILLLLVVGALAWSLRDLDGPSVWSVLSSAAPGWIALAVAVNLGVVALQAARWLALVRPLASGARFKDALESLLVCLAFSAVLPARAGELVRVKAFGARTGLPTGAVAATIGLDYLVNALALVAMVPGLLFFVGIPPWMGPGWLLAVSASLAACVLVRLSLRPRGDRAGARGGFLTVARRGLSAACRPRSLGLSFLAAVATWGAEICLTRIALLAVGIDLGNTAACLVLLAVNLALAVPLQPPGNFGTIEMGATLALTGMGVAKERALAFGVAYHLLQIVPVSALGLALWVGSQGRSEKTADEDIGAAPLAFSPHSGGAGPPARARLPRPRGL